MDQTRLLRKRDESIGRYQAVYRMTPANQRLHAYLATGLDAANGLVMDLEFAGADRPAQILLQFVALRQAKIFSGSKNR
jgi:hypothetical protein